MYEFPKEPKDLLSEELKRYVEELDWDFYEEFLQPGEGEEFREFERFKRDFTERLLRSKKIIDERKKSEPFQTFAEKNRALIGRWFDERYTLQQLENVASVVRRALRLSTLSARNVPNSRTNRFIEEATDAYIQGLPLASVALCRAALEIALKQRLGYESGEASYTSLSENIREAAKWHLLSETRSAKDLIEECNRVLHQGELKDEESAFGILIGVRSLLEEIYSAEGRF